MKLVVGFFLASILCLAAVVWLGAAQKQSTRQTSEVMQSTTPDKEKKFSAASSLTSGFAQIGDWIHDFREEIVAVGTIFIAAFTVILAFATGFLYVATRDLVKGAERTSQTQLRAFVFGKGFEQAINLFTGDRGQRYIHDFVFWSKIENVGLSPATDVKMWIMQQALPMNEDLEPKFKWDQQGGTSIVLGPGGSGQSTFLPIPIALMIELWEHKTQIYLGTRVEYRDIFDSSYVHHHEQCVILELLRYPADIPTEPNIAAVTMRAYGIQNSSA